MKALAGLTFAAALAVPVAAAYAQDATRGQAIFEGNCAFCHFADDTGAVKVGPNLFGVVGSEAGQRPVASDIASNALKASGVVWDEESLDALLSGLAAEFIPGMRMGFTGIADDAARADLIAYLASLSE